MFWFLVIVGTLWIAPILLTRKMGRVFKYDNAWLWGLFLGWIGVFVLLARAGGRMTSGRAGLEKMFGKETYEMVDRIVEPFAGEGKRSAMVDRMVEPFAGARKTCPDCAEPVQEAANVCKHCGHRFEAPPPSAPTTP